MWTKEEISELWHSRGFEPANPDTAYIAGYYRAMNNAVALNTWGVFREQHMMGYADAVGDWDLDPNVMTEHIA